MLVETVVSLSAILGLLLSATVFIFHVITRKREQREDVESVAYAVDKASDAAIEEITKTARLALEELNEKYSSLLFLYKLMDDKHRDIQTLPQPVTGSPEVTGSPDENTKNAFSSGRHNRLGTEDVNGPTDVKESADEPDLPSEFIPSIEFTPPPKYAQIKELQEEGLTIKEIAKRLGLGKGEVELVINLAVQSSKKS